MSQPLLGEYVDTPVDRNTDIISDLRDEIAALRAELLAANARVRQAESAAARSVQRLRKTLSPLYGSLQELFGEMNAISNEETMSSPVVPTPSNDKNKAVWESWKQRLGGTVAKGIDALLLHGEMNTQQLAIATGLNRNTVTNTVVLKLNRAGLINKNGGRFSLKQL